MLLILTIRLLKKAFEKMNYSFKQFIDLQLQHSH